MTEHRYGKQYSEVYGKNDRDSPTHDLRLSFAMLQDKGATA
jgi:hypothetical protein